MQLLSYSFFLFFLVSVLVWIPTHQEFNYFIYILKFIDMKLFTMYSLLLLIFLKHL